jgi:hypothetical protein
MEHPRRLGAELGLVAVVAFSACVVLPAYAQKYADPLTAEVKAEYDKRLSLYRMTDVFALDGLFAERQVLFLPITPPGFDPLVQPPCPDVPPFDWKNFPDEFNKRLVGEMIRGAPVYFVHVLEDPKNREVVFFNADGEEIYSLAPPKDYDPYWFVESRFPGVLLGRYSHEDTDFILSLHDPARIQMAVRLVPTENPYTSAGFPPKSSAII